MRAASLAVESWEEGHWKTVVGRVRLLAFSAQGGSVQLEGAGVRSQSMRLKAKSGVFNYNGREHRGDLIVTALENGLTLVAVMPMETYLVGVVNGEIDSRWPMDAVMAQVVAARTYALHRTNLKSPVFDLRPDTLDQVYAGAGSEDERAAEAVRRTRGEVLYRGGKIFPALFHSSCGGETVGAAEVWGVRYPSMVGVRCGECNEAPYSDWRVSFSPGEIRKAAGKLNPAGQGASALGIHRKTDDGRVLTLVMGTDEGKVLVDAADFRKVLGYERLPSTRFTLTEMPDGKISFAGSGYGHGVGLCQWGARGCALKGMNYRQILGKYYNGAEIKRAY